MLKGIIKTAMMYRYYIKFVMRLTVFLCVLLLYLTKKEWILDILHHGFSLYMADFEITTLHVLWAMFMGLMLLHLFPLDSLSMALRKNQKETYVEVPGYSELELMKFVQDQNVKAWKIMLIWLSGNAVAGLLYLFRILDVADLVMLTVFYFLSDYICILFFCPFQTGIMKNKCCVNCRIYDWGHFMMFTPMLFIQNFFSWSLFFTALIVLIRWEIIYAKHPERFWSGSNKTLQCANCQDKTCQIKNKLKKVRTE